MSSIKTYIIEIYPRERFFFGSDKTFGKDNENYFVRSRYFPQQTTLLGMLRYLLLKTNNLMDSEGKVTDKVEANKLIGTTGFKHNKNSSFGCIQSLSPLFISGTDGDYLVQSREYGLNMVKDSYNYRQKEVIEPLILKHAKGSYFNGTLKNNSIPYFDNLNSKTQFPKLLINARNGRIKHFDFDLQNKNKPSNGIFINEEQVGIRKKKESNDKKAFYKQVAYRMLQGYCFAFFANIELKNGYEIPVDTPIELPMGADTSWFKVTLSEADTQNHTYKLLNNKLSTSNNDLKENVFHNHNSLRNKIVFLSDTYLEREHYNKVLLASSETTPFSYMYISDNNSDFKRGSISLKKTTENFELLQRGSVLFVKPEEKEKILEILIGGGNDIYQAFHRIGYNYAI